MSKTREEILAEEFVRPELPGLRKFSTGILKLARGLGLGFAVDKGAQISPDADRHSIALAFLLDKRHSLDLIRVAAAKGWERFCAEHLDAYEFDLPPSSLALVQQELQLTKAAAALIEYVVAPKPGGKEGPAPPPNS